MDNLKAKKNGKIINIIKKIDGGGEGTIYKTNKPEFLAKIYKKSISQEKIQKLHFMVKNPPVDLTLKTDHILIAWPKDLLIDSQGNCLGFLMPEIQESQTLINVYSPKLREKKAPGFNWLDLHTTALNLASIIQVLHSYNYVVCDLKSDNLLVNEQGFVSIIDTDSFQIIEPKNRKVYYSAVASSEYTPPEMLEINLQTIERSEVQDRFGLAIIIWLLLFGYHPFSGNENQPNIDKCIIDGHWMYRSNSQIHPSKFSIPLNILHPALQLCFYKCFNDGHHNPDARPSAKDWVKALTKARKDLIRCSLEENHFYINKNIFYYFYGKTYGKTYGKCYWCERKLQLDGVDIFENKQDTRRNTQTITPNVNQIINHNLTSNLYTHIPHVRCSEGAVFD